MFAGNAASTDVLDLFGSVASDCQVGDQFVGLFSKCVIARAGARRNSSSYLKVLLLLSPLALSRYISMENFVSYLPPTLRFPPRLPISLRLPCYILPF